MFGGNLGKETAPKPQASMRLDDFWKLRVLNDPVPVCVCAHSLIATACAANKGAAVEED